MQTGTAPSGTVETVPDFRISLDGSTWPAASDGLAAGTGSVVDFQIQRDLTGGGLPGAARGGSGFSVASGSVTLPMGRAELTPWATASKRVSPGGLAWFRAHPTTLASITLGRFIVDSCSGASMGGLSLDLVESQRNLDGLFDYKWAYDADSPTFDASLVLLALAQRMGYTTSGWETSSASKLAFTGLVSGLFATGGQHFQRRSTFAGQWGTANHQSMIAPGSRVVMNTTASDDGAVAPLRTATLQVCMVVSGGPVVVQLSSSQTAIAAYSARITATMSGVSFLFTHQQSGVTKSVNVSLAETSLPSRKLEIWVDGDGVFYVTDSAPEEWIQGEVAIAGMGMSFLADTLTVDTTVAGTGAPSPGFVGDVTIADTSGGSVNTSTPTAYIEHTGSPLRGVFDVAGKSAREVFQDVARATMGAGWQSETGDLIYRNAASLRTGKPVEAVAIRDKVEDLQWSISRDNSADRVTVSYTPAEVQQDSAHKLTLWEATEPIMVPGNRTVTVTAEITGTTDRTSPFSIVTTNQADAVNATYSRWHASSSREGGGTRPADGAIKIETKIVSPSQVKLTITNTTSGTLWLVDGNGNPLVILRTSLQVQPGEPQVLEWGQPEDKALNPFAFDSGQWVQDAATAQAMLAWLADQLRSPLPTITQVRIIPDLRRQLGDIVTLTDEDSGLKAKALIIGISLEGDAGGYTQRLTLAILSVTYSDVRRWARAQGITTYGQLKAHLVANRATTYAKAREYLARVGVDA